jgi:regulator of protease activity HflC (stomatin/prohibitin superfamily)
VAVLYRDGQPVEALAAGRYRAWKAGGWAVVTVPLALQALDVAVQDLVTADQVAVRVKPTVAARVADALAWVRERATAETQVYAAVQLALREIVATRTLDALLAERDALGRAVLDRARELLPDVGLRIEVAAVKDIVLPGEVKDLLNKVTLARKEAEAQAIRRREEVAATRQLANTAKLLEQNPVLTRLKELEVLGEILGKIDKVTLVGTGDLVKDVLLTQVKEDAREA